MCEYTNRQEKRLALYTCVIIISVNREEKRKEVSILKILNQREIKTRLEAAVFDAILSQILQAKEHIEAHITRSSPIM